MCGFVGAYKTDGNNPISAGRVLVPADILNRPKMDFGTPMPPRLKDGFGACLVTRGRSDAAGIKAFLDRHRSGQAENAVEVWAFQSGDMARSMDRVGTART